MKNEVDESPVRELGTRVFFWVALIFLALALLPVLDRTQTVPVSPDAQRPQNFDEKSLITE